MQVQKSRRQEAMVQEGITTLASYVANNNDFKRMTSSWEVSILQHCNFHWRRFTLGTIYIGDEKVPKKTSRLFQRSIISHQSLQKCFLS